MSRSEGALPTVASPPPLPMQPAPDRAMGILKLVFAVAASGVGIYLLYFQFEQLRVPSIGQAVFLGVIVAFGLRLLVTSIAQVAGRRVGWIPSMALFAAIVGLTAWALPRGVQAEVVRNEQEAWERLQASSKGFSDYQSYTRWTSIPRKDVHAPMALAQIREELTRLEGEKTGRVSTLRERIRQYQNDMERYDVPEMQAAIELARERLGAIYAEALRDLALRIEAASAKSEFAEDPMMRAAFATLIDRVARSDDDRVYLVFSSENTLAALGSERAPEVEPASPVSPAADASALIAPGDAFSPTRDDRRRRSFEISMEEALGAAFAEPLLRIEPLPAGAQRKGKTIFQVHCATRRAPGEFILTRDGKTVGRLFNIEVEWEFSIFDTDGKPLTRSRSRSMPGDEFRFRRSPGDPPWAAYSVMMDSAYYSYCREVTGRLGLIPVGMKEYFTFEK